MKKYIVPTIKVEKIELQSIMEASLIFEDADSLDLPTAGGSKTETATEENPGHEAMGNAKAFNVWE